MTQETKLNPTNHPAGTRAIMQCWPRVARGEQTVREWSPSQARVRLSASAIGEGLWEDAEGWIVVEVLPSRAPLSCGESEASEDAHALRESLAQEIRGVLRARNCWAPERASDLIVAVARALDSAMMLAETIRKAPGSAPVADAEEGSAASIVEQCAKVCDDRAAYVQTIVDEIESGVRSQARFGHLDALRSQLSVLRTTARKIRLLAPPTPPPARPFPTEEECRRAFADVATVLPGSKGTGAGIAAVRSLCLASRDAEIERLRGWLTAMRESGKFRSDERGCYPSMALRGDPAPAALPAQTTSGTESEPRKRWICGRCLENERRVRDANLQPKPLEHCDDCALRDVPFPVSLTLPGEPCRFSIDRDMLPAAAPEPERETDVHTLTGNCRASAAVWIGDACNGGEYCDRCHEHDSPRGKCATCDRCACCDALFVKIMRVEDVDAAIAKRDRDLGAASPLPQSPQGGKPTNAN